MLVGVVAFDELGVPLVGFTADEPVEVVEALARRPMIERSGERRLWVRDQVPLADARGRVAVLAQDLGHECRGLRNRRRVPGNPFDQFVIVPIPTAWLFRPVSSAARVGEHNAVTWKRVNRSPLEARESSVGVGISPPNVAVWP